MEEQEKQVNGAFVNSLKRTNKEIKSDRADAISEDAEVAFKREVEDLSLTIKKKKRIRDNMLDLSPTNAQSLMVANEFDANEFVKRDTELGLEIRNLEIKYEIANKRYIYLFGGQE
jgi:hypothetical protein